MSPWFESYYLTTLLARDLWNGCSSAALKISLVTSGALNDVTSSLLSDSVIMLVLGNSFGWFFHSWSSPWHWLPWLFCISLHWLAPIPFQTRTETDPMGMNHLEEDSSLIWQLFEDNGAKAFRWLVLCSALMCHRKIEILNTWVNMVVHPFWPAELCCLLCVDCRWASLLGNYFVTERQ